MNFNLKKEWFCKIKNREKTHEYREFKPYWNKRITKVKLNKKARKTNKNIIKKLSKQTQKMICGNRLKFDYILKEISQIIEGEK